MSWTFVQAAARNSGGSNDFIDAAFTSINVANNIVFGVVCWQGAETIVSISDDEQNAYAQLGATAIQITGPVQINVALFWGFIYTIDTDTGLDVIVSFSDHNATQRFIAIGEFNPGTTYGTSLVDTPSLNTLSDPVGSLSPSIATLLSNLGELLVVGIYTNGSRVNGPTAGWTTLGLAGGSGQGAFFNILTSTSGSYTAQSCTTNGTSPTAIACGALNALNPSNPPPPPYYPLIAPISYPAYQSTRGTVTLLAAFQQIQSTNPFATLIDWNGNPYKISDLVTAATSGGLVSIAGTIVELRIDLGIISEIQSGGRFGTMYTFAPTTSPLAAKNTSLRYYSLGGVNTPQDPAIFVNPKVTGISIRHEWKKLETARGVYNWSFLDGEISRAVAAGLEFLIRIQVQASHAPGWLYNIAQYSSNFSGGKIWLYWDQNALAALTEMIQAVGQRYGSIPNFKIASVPCDTGGGGDWSVPQQNSDISLWQSLGYTSALNISACEQTIQAYHNALPNQVLTMACGRNGALDPTLDYVALAVSQFMQSYLGPKGAIQKNGMNAQTPDASVSSGIEDSFTILRLNLGLNPIGMQATWWTYGDPTYRNNHQTPADPSIVLHNMVQKTQNYAAQNPAATKGWFEVYPQDIENLSPVLV